MHQVIAAGLAYERRIFNDDYERATEAIQDAKVFLDRLSTNGKRIENKLDSNQRDNVSIEGYSPTAILEAQDVIVKIVIWTEAVYNGFVQTGIGFQLLDQGVHAMKEERYSKASEKYGEASTHFEEAQKTFEQAQGEGRELF